MNKNRQKIIILGFFIILLSIQNQLFSQSISGFVYDSITSEPLIGATLVVQENGAFAITDAYGYFSFSSKVMADTIQVSYVGYKTKKQEVNQNGMTLIYLTGGSVLEEAVVKGVHTIDRVVNNAIVLKPKITSPVIGMGGEADLLKQLTLFPGISQGKEGSSDMLVRGGSSDQNLFLIDGAPVFNTGHMFNFLSVFPTDAVNQATVYTSYFPPEYGGRISSVVDLRLKEGEGEHINGAVELGLLSTKALVQGTIEKKLTFLFNVRTSYFDLITLGKTREFEKTKEKFLKEDPSVLKELGNMNLIGMSEMDMTKYHYYDALGKLVYRFNETSQLRLSCFVGGDAYKTGFMSLSSLEESTWKMRPYMVSASYLKSFGSKGLLDIEAFQSGITNAWDETANYYDRSSVEDTTASNGYKTVYFLEGGTKFSEKHKLQTRGISVRFKYPLIKNVTIHVGAEAKQNNYSIGEYHVVNYDSLFSDNEETIDLLPDKLELSQYAGYAGIEVRPSEKFSANLGLRFSCYEYNKTYSKNYEPRISFGYDLGKIGIIRATYNYVTQPEYGLYNRGELITTMVWSPALESGVPVSSNNFSLGVHEIQLGPFSYSIEGYYKKTNNIAQFNNSATDDYPFNNWKQKTITGGKSKAYGLEFSGRIKKEKWEINTRYDLTWCWNKFESINNGDWFPDLFDRRHHITINSNFVLNKKWTLVANWVYQTGNRINFPSGYIPTNPFTYDYYTYEGVNQTKLPAYHRLDLSASYTIREDSKKSLLLMLSLYNAYFHRNTYYMTIGKTSADGDLKVLSYTFFPVVPGISLKYILK